MSKGKWLPQVLPGIEFDNPVAEEFDTEKHPISASLGNEDGQNKIDATLPNKKGKVSIRYVTLDNDKFFNGYLKDLKNHFESLLINNKKIDNLNTIKFLTSSLYFSLIQFHDKKYTNKFLDISQNLIK